MSRVLRHEGFMYIGKAIDEQKHCWGKERESVLWFIKIRWVFDQSSKLGETD